MTSIAILADDLTGAADTAAAFAAHHLTLIAFSARAPSADVLALSTESRHLPRAQARACVRAATAQVARAPLIYKKIDSTLRGDPAGELRAVLDALGETRALIAPAFPAQGRTTRDGRQHVDGVPLEHSAFAHESVTSDLRALFRDLGELTLLPLDLVRAEADARAAQIERARVCIADAETGADLAAIAAAAQRARVRVWCGSAGLARALAQQHIITTHAPPPRVSRAPRGAALIVAGSRHPRTRAQIEFVRAQGAPIVQADARVLTAEPQTGIAATVEAVCARAEHVVVLTTLGLDNAPISSASLAAHLAEIVARVIARGSIGKLVLTGGDVAAAVCRALGADALWVRGEIEPGVPHSILLGGCGDGLSIVTKGGGFGGAETLWHAVI